MGWLLLALALLVVTLVLLIPLDAVLDARAGGGELQRRARLEWLFGLVKGELRPRGAHPDDAGARERRLDLLAMWRTDGFPETVRRLLSRLRRSGRLRELSAHVRFGLVDPAETGRAMGVVAPALVLLPLPRGADVRVEPDFERERFDADLHARVRAWPLLALAAMVAFLLTRATWRALRAGRGA